MVTTWDRRQYFVLADVIGYVSLVLDSGELWECVIATIVDLLPPINILDVSCVLQVRAQVRLTFLIGAALRVLLTYHATSIGAISTVILVQVCVVLRLVLWSAH